MEEGQNSLLGALYLSTRTSLSSPRSSTGSNSPNSPNGQSGSGSNGHSTPNVSGSEISGSGSAVRSTSAESNVSEISNASAENANRAVQFAAIEAVEAVRIASIEADEANKAAKVAAEAAARAEEEVRIAVDEDAKLAEAAKAVEAVEAANAAEVENDLRIAAVEKEEANKAAQDAAEAAANAAEAVRNAAEEDAKSAAAAKAAEAAKAVEAVVAESAAKAAALSAAMEAHNICREATLKRRDEKRKETRKDLAIERKRNDEMTAKKRAKYAKERATEAGLLVANAERNASKTKEYNDALSKLNEWQRDWLKYLLSESSHYSGPKAPALGQRNRLIIALNSIPDPMERWVTLHDNIMIPQKKDNLVNNQKKIRDDFSIFYKDGNPFKGLTADPASSHMDTEEFFNDAFQNSPAVRRAYENALAQRLPVADRISDSIEFILKMASAAMTMLYEGVGDSIEKALSMLFCANHLYQKLESGLKITKEWINIRTFVFRTGAFLAVCFLYFKQETYGFLRFFGRKGTEWNPFIQKTAEIPIKIAKAVAYAAGREIIDFQKTFFAATEIEKVLAAKVAIERMHDNQTFMNLITPAKREVLEDVTRQMNTVLNGVEMAFEAYLEKAERKMPKAFGDTTHDPKFNGLANVRPPTTPNVYHIPDDPEFRKGIEMQYVDGMAQAFKGLTADRYFLEEHSLPGTRGIYRDYGGLEYVKLRFMDHLELFAVQIFFGDARKQHYRMHGLDPRKPCREDVCRPDEQRLIDELELKVQNPVYGPRALRGYVARTVSSTLGSLMELMGIRSFWKSIDSNHDNVAHDQEIHQAENPQLTVKDSQNHYDYKNDENVNKLLTDESHANAANAYRPNVTPLARADEYRYFSRDGSTVTFTLDRDAWVSGVLMNGLAFANASSAHQALLGAGGEDEEDVDQDINLIKQEDEILELFRTFSFKKAQKY